MADVLTVEKLMAETETDLPLSPRLSALLKRSTIKVKMLDGGRLGCLYPILPDEVATGNEAGPDLAQRERVWLRGLRPAERIRHRLEVENVKFHVLALVALDPPLTFEQAERFGDEANELYLAILRFSGLVPADPPPGAAAAKPARGKRDGAAGL